MVMRRMMIALMALALTAAIAPNIALARGRHLEQAIMETEEAIHAGKQHLASSLVEHSVKALDHARAALRVTPTGHIKSGIAHLKKAVMWAKHTYSTRRIARATREARVALAHLESVR